MDIIVKKIISNPLLKSFTLPSLIHGVMFTQSLSGHGYGTHIDTRVLMVKISNQGDKSASDHFKKINDAYDVLSDEKKRKDYDDFGDNWKHAKQMRDSGYAHQQFGSFSDLFSGDFSNDSSFRYFFGSSKTKKSKLQNISINISLEEAFSGTERRFNLKNNQSDNKIIDVKINTFKEYSLNSFFDGISLLFVKINNNIL